MCSIPKIYTWLNLRLHKASYLTVPMLYPFANTTQLPLLFGHPLFPLTFLHPQTHTFWDLLDGKPSQKHSIIQYFMWKSGSLVWWEWEKLPKSRCVNLVQTLLRRLDAIAAKTASTKYWIRSEYMVKRCLHFQIFFAYGFLWVIVCKS